MISLLDFLFWTTAFVNLVVAVLVYAVFRRDQDKSAKIWGLGCLLMAGGVVLLTVRQHLPGVLSFGFINFVMLYAMLMLGHASILLLHPDRRLPGWPLWFCLAYGTLQWALSSTPMRAHLSLVAALAWTFMHGYLWLQLAPPAKGPQNPYFMVFRALIGFGMVLWTVRAGLVLEYGIELSTSAGQQNLISLFSVHLALIAQQIAYLVIRLSDEKSRKEHIDELHLKLRSAWQSRQTLIEARQEERQQLLNDLHDGFGSKLACLRLLVQNGRVSTEQTADYLKEILADLHLFVDTLGDEDITLEQALIEMRYRTESHHDDPEPRLHWALELAGMPKLDKRSELHLLRVVQEALHNAIRHASASNIWIKVAYDSAHDRLTLCVSDDGKGMPTKQQGGQGMSSLQQRARELQGHLQIQPGHPGTQVLLTLQQVQGLAQQKLAPPV